MNRELGELLGELKVALPGVQILFAFQLTVPFTSRFESLGEVTRAVFFATFVATTLSTICFIAPAAHHRLRFRDPDKESMLLSASRFTIAGIAALAVAVCGVSYVFTEMVVTGRAWASAFTAIVTAIIVWAWYVVPLLHRIRRRKERVREAAPVVENENEKWK